LEFKMDAHPLFEPLQIKSLNLKNRIVMAPMTRTFADDASVPTESVAAYYRKRAEGEVALIITEGISPDHPAASYDRHVPALSTRAQVEGWKRVTEAVHKAGGLIAAQLWHVGRARTLKNAPFPDAPTLSASDIRCRVPSSTGVPYARPKAMSKAQIAEVQAAFARSAALARDAGFDAVEIHGAHGYLVDQFLWAASNNRSDEYGGSVENRVRFAAELVASVRRSVGPDFPLLFRFSQWKLDDYKARLAGTPGELSRMLLLLKEAGVDIFHASQRDHSEPAFPPHPLNLAGWAKKITGLPAIAVGKVALSVEFTSTFQGEEGELRPLDAVLAQMARGDYDLIAIGRALIADPSLPRKLREGRFKEIVPFRREMLGRLE
jgi:2,4-dienoyl-CoA reductase-like NADH-dependent reductase (Old Yellow Enzyme family)